MNRISEPVLPELLELAASSVAISSLNQKTIIERLNWLSRRLTTERFHLAVLGQLKRGKSTVLNALLGESILPTGVVPVTAIATFLEPAARSRIRVTYLQRRGEPVVFDHVAQPPPRLARFIGQLAEQIPVWIACRSDQPGEIGHVWEYFYKFSRIEIPPLSLAETQALIDQAVAQGNIQRDAREHADELYRMSGGNPRVLEELLVELAAREYKIDSSFGLNLLELDRRIHEVDLAIKATAEARTR